MASYAKPIPWEPETQAVQDAIEIARREVKKALVKEWTTGVPAEINPERLSSKLRAKRMTNQTTILNRAKPMSVTRAQKIAGLSLQDVQGHWEENREAALKWLKARGATEEEILDAYREHLKATVKTPESRGQSIRRLKGRLKKYW